MNVMLNKFLLKKKNITTMCQNYIWNLKGEENKPQLGEDGYGGREEAVV